MQKNAHLRSQAMKPMIHSTRRPRILLLSAYDAESHRQWRSTLQAQLPEFEWTQLSLPARYFSWRIRGNALSFAFGEQEILAQHYDLLIATSMVDLSTLRGFVPSLARIPTLLYFHENQFAYPTRDQQRENAELQIVPLYSALCADRVVFNSQYNRTTFLAGAKSLLSRLPDFVPSGLLTRLESASVLPVPLAKPREQLMSRTHSTTLEILWNHRWEYDKGPGLLLAIVRELNAAKLDCRLHIAGQQFASQPAEFTEIESLLQRHCTQLGLPAATFGFVDSAQDYASLMASCDVALSTALHDFQGLAVQEAALAGCAPLAPSSLVYPEYLPNTNLFALGKDDEATARTAVKTLKEWQRQKACGESLPRVDLEHYTSPELVKCYRSLLLEMIEQHEGRGEAN